MDNLLVWLISLSFIAVLFAGIIIIGNRYNGANWGHPGTNILDGWMRLYCKKFHRQGDFKIELPESKGLILAANHISSIDPFLLIAATNKPIRFMIAKEEYQKPYLNWMFKAAGCIPVDRGGRVEGAFRSALRAIEAGETVAIFPQGGIHSDSTPRHRIKPGIIKLSHMSGCDILPVRIKGVSVIGTMVRCLIFRGRITFDVSSVVSSKQAQTKEFRQSISDWMVGDTDEITF